MNRKDVILIAVLANIGVLGILFMFANKPNEGSSAASGRSEVAYSIDESYQTYPQQSNDSVEEIIKVDPVDEIDAFIEEVIPSSGETVLLEEENIQFIDQEPSLNEPQEVQKPATIPTKIPEAPRLVDVTVKQGDVLEKIARANGTTVDAIMKENQLKSDRLRIGQVLRVPVGVKVSSSIASTVQPKVNLPQTYHAPATTTSPQAMQAKVQNAPSPQAQYYVMKKGDNPWKIAKQFNIKVDQLLKFNNLDEESARKLKPGDTIRVK